MSSGSDPIIEETLDPKDWTETRELGHRMLSDVFDDLSTIRSRPAWKQIPAEAKAALSEARPRGPQSLESVYDEFRKNIEPFALRTVRECAQRAQSPTPR